MPHKANHVSTHALGVVAGAAIPAAVIGSLALAPAAYAAPAVSVNTPGSAAKSVTPENIKIAEDQIKAHLIASRVPSLGLPAKASTKEIQIPAGASLSSIAVEYKTTVAKLKDLNNLKSDFIVAGKTLKVPGHGSQSKSSKASSSSASSATGSYTVKSGDTLSAIAAKHKMGLADLLKKNDISSSTKIFPGDKIKVNGGSTGSSGKGSSSGKSSSNSSGSASYTVQAGDTLGGIAIKHNMSLSALLSKNGISASKPIFPGDKLTINGSAKSSSSSGKSSSSSKTSGGASYTVTSGDTLSGIAAKNGMKLGTLLSLNGISASKPIFPGDKIKVSGSASSSSTSTSSSSSKPSAGSSKASSYSVKSGDTLGGIAAKHGMKLSDLLDKNPQLSTSTPLQIGDKVKVSGSSVSSTSTGGSKKKIGNTFLGRTYADHVVSSANENKDYLDSVSVPSRSEMQSIIVSTANRMGVDPALALAHSMQESGFNMRAVSPANALGAMQVIPSTGEWMSSRVGKKLNLLDPQDNVTAGVAVIRYNLDNTSNLDDAIAAYYQGLGGVRKYGMYDDTKRYVASVKSLMKQYR
ncbi:LysM peptidoglycan-binding domain-containing protein [Glutamicibacter protophormiae]|uniref:LysM peptidoglycan-binding domain-containing protein n=1 Tax=Glutamicibacter protophormiae TaxID=37930 RepID=UPI002A82BDFB|nr:LysM peptidoglycan-binding domain-containing protein [Glutamicibacter protophormiae]WPR63432.1 LysM peptidoglycan-binding domain-containing protein [Glutamicibacter protophormiae]WPR66928.1 LysM peptidoglycan-binding domain-containing protein [Glutamicibacter protophormiae]